MQDSDVAMKKHEALIFRYPAPRMESKIHSWVPRARPTQWTDTHRVKKNPVHWKGSLHYFLWL